MRVPDLSALAKNAEAIIDGVGREAIDVYLFLFDEFARGSIREHWLFQFVFRSYYQLDSAGLTDDFKAAYFECMEEARGGAAVDLAGIVGRLRAIRNRKGQESLQFSFVTKLANTVNPRYPIYDYQVAQCFRFTAPYNYKTWEVRLGEYLDFYGWLRAFYENALATNSMKCLIDRFMSVYAPKACRIPPVKILDFNFLVGWEGHAGVKQRRRGISHKDTLGCGTPGQLRHPCSSFLANSASKACSPVLGRSRVWPWSIRALGNHSSLRLAGRPEFSTHSVA